MGGQNLPHNIETQAGAPRLGGVERLENPRYLLGGNTDPTIADAQLDLQSGAETFQAQRAPRGHGLDGILHHIEHGPAQGAGVKGQRPHRGVPLQHDGHALLRRTALHLRRPRLHGRPDVLHAQLDGADADEGEIILHQLIETCQSGPDLAEGLHHHGRALGRRIPEFLLQQIDVQEEGA